MTSLPIMKSTLYPFPTSSRFREFSCFPLSQDSKSDIRGGKFPRLRKTTGLCGGKRLRVRYKVQEGDNGQSNGEEPPESLFMKELRKRGITRTSLLEESRSTLEEDLKEKESDGFSSKRNAVSLEADRSLTNQREQSMALNSEGLEANLRPTSIIQRSFRIDRKGLIPRAKLLLTLGGTFFVAFGPLIIITVATFSALYFYFGPTFVHDGSRTTIPPYIDPYELLQDERISQLAPRVN